jgi:hypothetical protein
MKRIRVALTALLVGAFMLLSPSSAFAESVMTTITCATPNGQQQEFGVGWDNSNEFFNGRGEIPRLYCEGGYAGIYTIYVSDALPLDDPRRWFNGVALLPEPVESSQPEPVPSIEPSLDPEPTPIVEPTQEPTPDVTPTETATPTAEPIPVTTQTPEPTPIPVPVPEPTVEVVVPVVTPEPVVEPTPIAPDFVPDLVPEPEPIVEPEPVEEVVVEEPTVEELTQEVIDDALADGVLTDTERELVADALLAEFIGEAITFEALQESGLDYEDLPLDTPITLENGVVLTAEIADAIEIFESGSEFLATVFDNPAKALKAFVNIGADMTEEERETSQNTVVAAVVVTQVAQVRKIK